MRCTMATLLALAMFSGCGSSSEPSGPDGGGGGGGGGSTDAGTESWTVVETTTDDGEIVIEKIRYRSGALNIYGQVCRPASGGPFATYVINHGGFEGLTSEWNGGACADYARAGFVVLESSYRGEDGSDGDIEVCGGEVDDVLALIDLALDRPELINADAMFMWGASHGGCITLQAVARGAPVRAASAAVPPTDFAALHQFWSDGLAGNPNDTEQFVWTELIAVVEEALGGTPEQVPEAYADRSPVTVLGDIVASDTPVMIVHGVTDFLVPPSEGCAFAAGGFEARYVTDGNGAVSTNPDICAGFAIDWQATARPSGTWPGRRYIQLYHDMGHGFEGQTGPLALFDTIEFPTVK